MLVYYEYDKDEEPDERFGYMFILTECSVKKGIHVGSVNCMDCEHFNEKNKQEQWVDCASPDRQEYSHQGELGVYFGNKFKF